MRLMLRSTLTLFLLAAPLAAQSPDTALTSLITQLLQSEFRGGGWRDTLVWQPRDSVSSDLIRRLTLQQHDTVLAVGRDAVECPGSTNSAGVQLPQPTGYTLRARAIFRGLDSATVDLQVSCRFTYRGDAHAFAQQAIWEVAKGRNGWRVVRLLAESIT
jgi:hypothetical protein